MDKKNKLDIILLVSHAADKELISLDLHSASKKIGVKPCFHSFVKEDLYRLVSIKNKVIFADEFFFKEIVFNHFCDQYSPVILLQQNGNQSNDEASEENFPFLLEKILFTQANEYTLSLLLKRAYSEIEKNLLVEKHQTQKNYHDNLFKSITSILIGLNADGTIALWNRVAEYVFKVKAEDVVGKKIEECSFDWDKSRVVEAVRESLHLKIQNQLEDIVLKQDGQEILLGFTLNPFAYHAPGQVAILLYGADITEKVKSRKALQSSNEMLKSVNLEIAREKAKDQAILASIADALVVTDDEGRIVLVNKQAKFMFEWVQKDVIGEKLVDAVPLMDETGALISAELRPSTLALKTKNKSVCFANYCQRENNLIPLQISSAPVMFEENQIGAITLFRNISHEKEIENMKSEFVSTVSHELRTPLTSIREGVAQVFEELLGPINEDQKEFLTIAMDEIDRLTSIINDLLDISKIESGGLVLRKSWVDFVDLLRPVIFNYKNLTKSKNIELVAKFPLEEMVEIYCDPDKIKQIITNLLTNAYKFTNKGGKIEVELINEEDQIRIAIRDTGVGISKENLPKVFRKFLQVGRTAGPGIKGTGLGLTICKHLVELHTGKIWVESTLDHGSCFYFTLPKLEKDFAAKENIEHGLGDLSENSTLSLIMYKLDPINPLVKIEGDLKPHTFLKSFMKKMMRGPMNGLGDIFLNGANECIIILPGVKKEEAREYAEKFKNALLKNISMLSSCAEPIYQVDVGLSSFPEDAESSESLLKKARIQVEGIDNAGAERRIQKRADYEMNLNAVSPGGKLIEMQSIDISEGGLQLTTRLHQPIGKVFNINLKLPRHEKIMNLKSLVVWARKTEAGYLIGVKFLEVTNMEREIIRRFIDLQNSGGQTDGSDIRKTA
jgi:PAS domain S-box-containing protein